MIAVTVQENGASTIIAGDDIVDEMIATLAMARRRGAQEISTTHRDRRIISGTGALQGYLQPGMIVLYTDRSGTQHRCILKSSASTVTRTVDTDGKSTLEATTDLVLEYKEERHR